MAQAIDDLEAIRRAVGVDEWIVLGHSWGSDQGVRYALERPDRVRGVVGIAGHGLHSDREWSTAYEAGKANEVPVEIDWVPEVHAALLRSFKDWIHRPTLWRALADSAVPMVFIAAGKDSPPELAPPATRRVGSRWHLSGRARCGSRLVGHRRRPLAGDLHPRMPPGLLSQPERTGPGHRRDRVRRSR
jgi:pimeloyl-ACP methyl ester carboxylesterase